MTNSVTIHDMTDPKRIVVQNKEGKVVLDESSENLFMLIRQSMHQISEATNSIEDSGNQSKLIPQLAYNIQTNYGVALNLFVVAKLFDEVIGQMQLLKKTLQSEPSSPALDSTGASSPPSNE
jgi:hypothetical protein